MMASVTNETKPQLQQQQQQLASSGGDQHNVLLTIRLIMQGKEVGSIIGRKGEIVKSFREESGARINISDGSCPERIVTVTGSADAIFKAFSLICKKLEDVGTQENQSPSAPKSPITLRLVVPASQCGSLIGKGGAKIREIRETSGANIQIASDLLPNSTERTVTLSGTHDAVTQCIYHICCVMIESPPKIAPIPYRPKPHMSAPVILAGGQAYTIQGNFAVPTHPDIGKLGSSPLSGLLGLAGLGGGLGAGAGGALTGLAGAGGGLRALQQQAGGGGGAGGGVQTTQEMTVPNELIGCIIGKGGTKIAEIRQMSGAMIRISNSDPDQQQQQANRTNGTTPNSNSAPPTSGGGGSTTTERIITITGSPDAVSLAQYLINMRIAMETAGIAIPPGYPYIPATHINHFIKAPIH